MTCSRWLSLFLAWTLLLQSLTTAIPATAGEPNKTIGYTSNDWLWKETRSHGTSVYYDYDANGAIKYERTFSPGGVLIRLSELTFTYDGKLSQQRFWEPGTSTMVTSQTLYNYDGDGNRVGLQRQQLGALGMSYGVVTSENHDFLVDTSQPYAEVIQEKTWLSDGAGNVIGDAPVVDRYDIGLDRLRVFRYQLTANGPPTTLYTNWLLFDGLGSTRALVGDSGSVVDEFGYSDAFGIPYRVTANGSGRDVAGPGFFLNGQQWDGGSSWGRSYWSGTPAFNSGEGLYFNRARYYQPGLGRFVGEDAYEGKGNCSGQAVAGQMGSPKKTASIAARVETPCLRSVER